MSPQTRWALVLGVLVVLAVFGPTVAADYVYDDHLLIRLNYETTTLAQPWRFFGQGLWAGTPTFAPPGMYYRPLMALSVAVDRALFGLVPGPAHLHSLLWHMLGTGALLGLLHRLELPAMASVAGALVFALHPAQVEPVVFLSARNDLMAGALVLGGVALLLGAPGARVSRRGLVLGGLCLLAAGLSKESALLAPVVLLVLSVVVRRRAPQGGALGIALGAVGSVVLMRALAGVGTPPNAGLARVLAAAPDALLWWCRVVVWPVDLVPGMALLWPPARPWWALVVVVVFVGVLVRSGGRRALGGLALSALTLAPALPAVAHTGLVPDRYLYLPMAGLGIAVAAALAPLTPRMVALFAGGLGLVLALLSATTVPRWQDDTALWTATLARMPTPHVAASFAKVLELEGDLDQAAEWYGRALVAPIPARHACWNIARVHLLIGDPLSAARMGEQALTVGCPLDPELLAPTALAHALIGEWDLAEQRASMVGEDPTGQAIVVRVTAAARRGDLGPFYAAAGDAEADQAALARQVVVLLDSAGEPSAVPALR